MKLIGLDVGEKRIGIARADTSTRIAVPVGFINVDGTEWQEIARLANLHNTQFFVVGLPRSNEGNETEQSVYVRNFVKNMVQKVPGVKVRFQDESLTSVVAEERLKARRKAYEKGEIDAEAASIILQDFLESFMPNNENNPSSTPVEPSPEAPSTVPEEDSKIQQGLQDAKDLAKKETDKMKLKTKKAKHQTKTAMKSVSIIAIIFILLLLAGGGFLWYKHQRDEERARYYAELEAQMNAESTFQFTIRPGENIFEIKDSLVEAGYEETEVNEAFDAEYDFAFLKERPEGATLEGYLYGETYEFFKTDSVKVILTKFLEGTEKVITENNLEEKYAEQGLTLHEGITLASVVQSESGRLTSEMPTVARVFLNRIANGIMLGSDVTVTYALDVVDPDRETYADNQAALKIDSCYNTRLHAGLPCGPISNPGLEALQAVAEPTDTAYLYFLTGDDGMMYYSYTEAEHNQNVYDHCKDLCNTSL